jgi:hypothetical protein
MKVSYGEGLAAHTGSESCIGDCKGAGEALTGVRAGQVLSREIETPSRKRWPLRGADAVEIVGRQNWERRYRETLLDSARSETLCMYVSTLSGNREILCLSLEKKATDRIGKSKDARR